MELRDHVKMMSILEEEFGTPRQVVDTIVTEMEKLKPVTSDKMFIDYVEKLEKIQRDLTTVNCLEEISNSTIIGKLEFKLPMDIKKKWADIVIDEKLSKKTTTEKFTRFMAFLNTSKEKIKYLTSEARFSSVGNKDETCFVTGIVNHTTRKFMVDKVASELRKLRGIIYRKIKRKKPEEELNRTVQNYMVRVDKFVNKFRKVLTKSEKKIWQLKKSKTYQDLLDYCEANESSSEGFQCENTFSDSASNEEVTQGKVVNESIEKDTASFVNILEILPDIPQHEPGSDTCSDSITVKELEKRLLKLKDQQDVFEVAENLNEASIDEKIESRLLRLKFFRQAWCEQTTQIQRTSEQEPLVCMSEFQPSETFPTSSTPHESSSQPCNIPRLYDHNPVKSKSQSRDCKENVSRFHCKNSMDSKLVNSDFPYTSSPNMVDLQGVVLVLVLTFLKLLCHPKFRLRLQFVPPNHSYQSDITTACSVPTTTMSNSTYIYSSVLSAVKGARLVLVWCNVRDQVQGALRNCKARLGLLLREKVRSMRKGSAQVIMYCFEKVHEKVAQVATVLENDN